MDINTTKAVASLTEAFDVFKLALFDKEVETVDVLFCNSRNVVRYGPNEARCGADQIPAFRKSRLSVEPQRIRTRTVVKRCASAFGTSFTECRRPAVDRPQRQRLTRLRMPEGCRVVAADVSFEEAQNGEI
ncbi:MAG: AtzH-like domain-containing protein [Pseudomonadota bacterium]